MGDMTAMRTLRLCGLALGLSVLAPAARAEMPQFDLEDVCRRVATIGRDHSPAMHRTCLLNEMGARERLRPRWEALAARPRQNCEALANVGGPGSFMILESCLRDEIGSAFSERVAGRPR